MHHNKIILGSSYDLVLTNNAHGSIGLDIVPPVNYSKSKISDLVNTTHATHGAQILPSGSMGFGGPGGAASATIALASSVEIRLGLPVTVVLALRQDVRA